MLFSLNAAMYPSEVGAVKWKDVELSRREFSSKRKKTKVPRRCRPVARDGRSDECLAAEQGNYLQHLSAEVHPDQRASGMVKVPPAADKPALLFNQIRDAAFTIACQTDLNQARSGWPPLPGAVDHYVETAPLDSFTLMLAKPCGNFSLRTETSK